MAQFLCVKNTLSLNYIVYILHFLRILSIYTFRFSLCLCLVDYKNIKRHFVCGKHYFNVLPQATFKNHVIPRLSDALNFHCKKNFYSAHTTFFSIIFCGISYIPIHAFFHNPQTYIFHFLFLFKYIQKNEIFSLRASWIGACYTYLYIFK